MSKTKVQEESVECEFDRFDLEQLILSCWGVTDDLALVQEHIMEEGHVDVIKVAGLLTAIRSLYTIKFEKCFNVFEDLIAAKKVL